MILIDPVGYFIYGMCVMFYSMMAWFFWRKGSDVLSRLIKAIMLIYVVESLKDLIIYYYVDDMTSRWWAVMTSMDIVIIPFYIFVLMELVKPGWLTWRKGILHEVPFVVLPLLYIITEHAIWYYIIAAWAVFYGSATLVLTFFFISQYHRVLKERFSYEDNINLHWLRAILVSFFFILAAWTCSSVMVDMQLYSPDNITFGESAVCLNFRKESIIGKYWDRQVGIREKKYDYSSAMISSATALRQRYGRFEAKIKLNRCALTSCFWMLGDTEVPHVEIMKCEADGVHMGRVYSYRTAVNKDIQLIKELELDNAYYIFTLEWTENKMVWMVNDLVVKEETEHIPDVPMYVVFSLGTNKEPLEKQLPSRMEIDWFSGYRLKS